MRGLLIAAVVVFVAMFIAVAMTRSWTAAAIGLVLGGGLLSGWSKTYRQGE